VLVILQPVAVGAWCTLCLVTAAAMLIMITPAIDEVVAMGQFLTWSVRHGKPFWWTFWVGGTMEGGGPDHRTATYGAPVLAMAPAMTWGVSVPWTLLVSAVLGIWLMFAPWALGMEQAAASSNQVAGALIVTVSVIVMAEVVRAGRFLNALLGAWIVVAPWLVAQASTAAAWNNLVAGAAVVVLSIPRGTIKERYGGWDRYVV
jgi:hypothetical protein